MDDCVNNAEYCVLRKLHCKIVETLDVNYVQASLYQNGCIPSPLFLADDNVRSRRNERLLEYLMMQRRACRLVAFLDAIREQYPFLANEIEREFQESLKNSSTLPIARHRTESFGSPKHRMSCLKFRHFLKRSFMNGNLNLYFSNRNAICAKWKNLSDRERMSHYGRQMADKYFMALDAECERQRIVYNKRHVDDTKLFFEMQNIGVYTSSASIPEAMFRARMASAMGVAGRDVQLALKLIEDAKQKLCNFQACRESGIILNIEYNLRLKLYDHQPNELLKTKLLSLGELALDHLSTESSIMASDYRRMMLLKLAHIQLGMGLFQKFYFGIFVSPQNIEKAKTTLRFIEEPENWKRMEDMWKLFYYSACARVCHLQGQLYNSIVLLKKAAAFAEKAYCTQELIAVNKNITVLKSQLRRCSEIKDYSVSTQTLLRRSVAFEQKLTHNQKIHLYTKNTNIGLLRNKFRRYSDIIDHSSVCVHAFIERGYSTKTQNPIFFNKCLWNMLLLIIIFCFIFNIWLHVCNLLNQR